MADDRPSHPSAVRLGAFAAGRASDADIEEIAPHLDGCASCRRRVEEVSAADPFLRLLRGARRPPGTCFDTDEPV